MSVAAMQLSKEQDGIGEMNCHHEARPDLSDSSDGPNKCYEETGPDPDSTIFALSDSSGKPLRSTIRTDTFSVQLPDRS